MISFPPVEGFDFTKGTYDEFVGTLPPPGWTLHDLGESTYTGRNVYGISYGDLVNKPVIYIEGAIHGNHEWRTAHWVKGFAELLTSNSAIPSRTLIRELLSKFSFYLIPCLNPYGYEYTHYANGNDVNLNRNFGYFWDEYDDSGDPFPKGSAPFSEPESLIVKNVIEQYKPVAFVDTHTWGSNNGGTSHRSHSSTRFNVSIERLVENIDFFTRPRTSADKWTIQGPLFRPTAADWAGSVTNKNGTKIFSQICEVGSGLSEFEQSTLGLNYLLLTCLYVSHWYNTSELLPVE